MVYLVSHQIQVERSHDIYWSFRESVHVPGPSQVKIRCELVAETLGEAQFFVENLRRPLPVSPDAVQAVAARVREEEREHQILRLQAEATRLNQERDALKAELAATRAALLKAQGKDMPEAASADRFSGLEVD